MFGDHNAPSSASSTHGVCAYFAMLQLQAGACGVVESSPCLALICSKLAIMRGMVDTYSILRHVTIALSGGSGGGGCKLQR